LKNLIRTLLAGVALATCVNLNAADYTGETRWWKGNTHTHSWWSDGDTPPEVIADWYKQQGYNFLVFSDHNVMQEGEKWYAITKDPTRQALTKYREMFGDDWVIQRQRENTTEVKLKTLDEFRALFEQAGQFIFIRGEEITDRYRAQPIHMNGVNLVDLVKPQGGNSVASTLQNNIDAVQAQSRHYAQPMLVHLNHPNFHYAVQPEDFFHLQHEPGEGFFEIYNGHPGVENYGDELHHGTERMWDIVLSKRLGELKRSVVYGMAVDDAHEYTAWGVGETNPGRGWVMVRSKWLTPNEIAAAMKRGDFYNSSGVELESLDMSERELRIKVAPKPGVKYRIEFIGTRRGADLNGKPRELPHQHRGSADHDHRIVYEYSKEVGAVLASVEGGSATYTLRGDEIYVRARVTSTRLHPNPFAPGDVEMAWTQPLIPSN
jgi:hypothetical protein